jgi:polyisoprenyl-phosphate glycosyltransferase
VTPRRLSRVIYEPRFPVPGSLFPDVMLPLISVVVPCYNEAEALPHTHARLSKALDDIPDVRTEIVYVDDGSRDATAEILRRIQVGDRRVRVVRFSRNFGHQIAVTAGIDHAAGDAVVLIDGDLQDPPELIAEFVRLWKEGIQVAYGLRTDRPGETRFKLWTARMFYRLLQRLTDVPIPLDVGDFRLMDRLVVDSLRRMPERHRFLRGMIAWVGFRQAAVPYQRAARIAGESKYPLFKMMKFALDGITSFSNFPLRIATWFGFFIAGAASLGVLYALIVRLFTRNWVSGWAGLFIAVLFLGGVQLISLGIIGEYVGRIYAESKQRPLYLVSEALGFDGHAPASLPPMLARAEAQKIV